MPEDSKLAKRKIRDDKIDWEELERAPNMRGMLSYLTPVQPEGTPPGESGAGEIPRRNTVSSDPLGRAAKPTDFGMAESQTPPRQTPTGETPQSVSTPSASLERGAEPAITAFGGTAAALAPERGEMPASVRQQSESPGSERLAGNPPGSSQAGAVVADDLLADPLFRETPTTMVPGFGKRRFHRCLRVEDAHTAGEQLLLETLYRLALDPRWGKAEPAQTWLVTISMDELARHVRLHRTNVRANLTKLRAKLAIDLVALEDVREQSSRTYRIYPPDQILARRRQAGLEWVVKNRSVSFVPDEMVAEAIRQEMPQVSASPQTSS